MDNTSSNSSDTETLEKKNSNSEWLPTKCRITKPPPPKPATNPLQFVKIYPNTLFNKTKDQIKKVEEIKKHIVKEEAEEWQQNLDNWKSSRRKRQEHIIERVVEVKKFEQDWHDQSRRKSKTFSEMLEDRNKRGHRLNIPIYDDESNDLSDYGIASSGSKSNGSKDNDTFDSISCLDNQDSESVIGSDSTSSQSQNIDKFLRLTNSADKENNHKPHPIYRSLLNNQDSQKLEFQISAKGEEHKDDDCSYKKIIENYRSKIVPNQNESAPICNTKFNADAGCPATKVKYHSNKDLFQIQKPNEPYLDFNAQKRHSEDFANSLSIKDRLKSLEQCAELQVRNIETDTQGYSVKSMIKNLNEQNIIDIKNNNLDNLKKNKTCRVEEETKLVLLLAVDNSNQGKVVPRSSSLEVDAFMNKLNMFNQHLDSFITQNERLHSDNTAVASPIELFGLSDREDSGIHTADVSCSVSQADESVEYCNILSAIPNCIEKLQKERERELTQQVEFKLNFFKARKNSSVDELELNSQVQKNMENIIQTTQEFLDNVKQQISNEFFDEQNVQKNNTSFLQYNLLPQTNVIYDSQDRKKQNSVLADDFFISAFPLAPPKTKEPPKEKPPPPPRYKKYVDTNLKRLNSTKKLKTEIHIKRSSFLGLDESADVIEKVSPLDNSFYKKYQDTHESWLSEVESQDSGLESERGRLSSDTWCSSLGEPNSSTHPRQDNEQTYNSVKSEDELAKQEKEIIALVEEEEQLKDFTLYSCLTYGDLACCNMIHNSIKNEEAFNIPYFPKYNTNCKMLGVNQSSEVSKAEHEIAPFRKEHSENQKQDNMFQNNSDKSNYSLENISDGSNAIFRYYNDVNCRKSLPDLSSHLDNVGNCNQIQSIKQNIQYYKPSYGIEVPYRKSMPDIQQAYLRSADMCNEFQVPVHNRKSMPELQKTQFSVIPSYTSFKRQPIAPGEPLTLIKEQQDKDKTALTKFHSHFQNEKSEISIIRPDLNILSAVPKYRCIPNDNWVQPKINGDKKQKNYNSHWLYQEAELRRIAEQRNYVQQWNWQPTKLENPVPTLVAQTLTTRMQKLTSNEGSPHHRRSNNNLNQEIEQNKSYRSQPPILGHALPIPYPPFTTIGNSEGKVLSISGKKKCSFCGNELGRGAAMIIESLCLFYHMDCFKCCVCHIQLGDGLMGTDVRVRNQKVHCHNCYTSDDGVKFSCV